MDLKNKEIKFSFPPVANADIEVLILGTLPGDNSIKSGEYFAHPRNRFWKIISEITNQPVPVDYSDKLELLKISKIGVWNVLQKAERKGSLDSAIQKATPNDIESFLKAHKKIKIIGFDGRKAEALYDKYFTRKTGITYLPLPGCSPANARYTLEALCEKWREILK